MLYHDAALRRERHQRAGNFSDIRAAFVADKNDSQKHLRSLIKD
ncbi:hypothetical protein [Microbulbifer okhotskensis]|nr:hypothetical protein [Microbulbifer okhotskensis]